jgi:hypothetical protein
MTKSRKKVNNKHNLKRYSRYLYTYMMGILSFYFTQRVNNYILRPIIITDLGSVSVNKISNKDWEIKINLLFKNTGKSSTTINLKKVSMYFPEYSNRPYEFETNKFYKIEERSSKNIIDSFSFPSIFDSLITDSIPKLKEINLTYSTIENQKLHGLKIDSSKIVYMIGLGIEHLGPNKLKSVRIDTSKKLIRFATDQVYIDFKGNRYLNHVYPPGTRVNYQIDGENIQLEYQMLPIKTKFNSSSNLIDPIIFFPHKDLRDKILLPKMIGFKFMIEKREKGRIKYNDYNIEFGENLMTFYYLIQ